MKEIKVGIIGTGVGLRTHYPGFSKLDNVQVAALSGSSLSRSKEFAAKYKIPYACSSYMELCELSDIDLVCVTAPNKYHLEMVKYAMKNKKNIICEKPVSEKIDEVIELNELAKNYDRILVVDHQLRYNPYINMIKELVKTNQIGTPYLVRINQEGTGFSKNDVKWSWSFDANEGGGVRLAMASHLNDLVQYWFGNREVLSVSGYLNPVFKSRFDSTGKKRVVDASTICSAKIDLMDELSLTYTINAGAYRKFIFEIDIYGDNGQIHFDLENKLSIYKRETIGNEEKIEVEGVFPDERENKASLFSGSFRYFAPKIINAVRGQKDEISRSASINDALYNCEILQAIKDSANTGKSITFKKVENNYV